MQKHKNQERLILQNRKLREEIFKIQEQIQKLIHQNIIQTSQSPVHAQKQHKYQSLSMQESYIKKLKNKIFKLKSVETDNHFGLIANEENNITAMKRLYEKLQTEKQMLTKVYSHKKQGLDLNKPLDTLKNKTEEKLAKYRHDNTNLFTQIYAFEKQVRKLHKYEHLKKSVKDKKIVIENPQFQLMKLDHQIKSFERRTKEVQDQWKPQFQTLDAEFLTMKEIINRKEKIILEDEKEQKLWQARSSASRSQTDVLLDRQRLSKILTQNTVKKKENPSKFQPTKRTFRNNEKTVNFKGGLRSMVQSVRIESKKNSQKEGKNKMETNSIGVGTSFYLNQEENE